MERVVGISEFVVSRNPDDVLLTYSLGSCVGLVLHDSVAGVGGLLHSLMPTAKANPERAARTPAMYADSGASTLLQAVFDHGATRPNLVAYLAGAASHLDAEGLFRIGERNYTIARRILWKNGIFIAAEDVGGTCSRTVSLEVGSGRAFIRSQGAIRQLASSGKGK